MIFKVLHNNLAIRPRIRTNFKFLTRGLDRSGRTKNGTRRRSSNVQLHQHGRRQRGTGGEGVASPGFSNIILIK